MKITVRKLRRAISEAIRLSEAPLADISSFVKSIERGDEEEDVHDDERKLDKTLTKFFKSPSYKKLAIKTYKNLSVPIHIVPYGDSLVGVDRLITIREPAKVEVFLSSQTISYSRDERAILDPESIKSIVEKVARGDSVWFVCNNDFSPGAIPSPWMTVHAMFDADSSLSPQLYDIFEKIETFFDDVMFADTYAKGVLTMKSGRDGTILSERDAAAEVMCQQILTTNGFQFNPTGDPLIDAGLESFKELLQPVRELFEAAVRGTFIVIDVDTA